VNVQFTVSFISSNTVGYVQFTFTKIMNEFMNFRSMNALRYNTGHQSVGKRF